MARKNIFEKTKSLISFKSEMMRIDELLDREGVVEVQEKRGPRCASFSYEEFIDAFTFKEWKARCTYIDCYDMRRCLGIQNILEKNDPNQDDILTYLEYVANIFMLYKTTKAWKGYDFCDDNLSIVIVENLNIILDWMNYEQKEFKDEQKVLLVEKNASATAVAEIVDTPLAHKIIQYNHFTLKGDIATKKSILISLGSELESKQKNLIKVNNKLKDNIFYMLNNINLRHNNVDKTSKSYKEYVANLAPENLEELYDELYQMCLLAFLELDQVERNKKIDELKLCIEQNKTQ